jgi:cytosine/adenosine deaminase-related metal-dependent hydrolase
MSSGTVLGRRRFLAGAATFGALGFGGFRKARAQSSDIPTARPLPPREHFVIRGAHVLSMDPAVGEFAQGDVHVRNGEIVAVGPALNAPGAMAIDGANAVVLPGFVETHWHLWTTLLRGMIGHSSDQFYFPMSGALGRNFRPADVYQGVRLSTVEALYGGITTVTDWSHNNQTREHSEANIKAIADSGMRARYLYGPYQGQPNTQSSNMAELERFHNEWQRYSNEGLITLGMSWRGIGNFRGLGGGGAAVQANLAELQVARRLKLPVSVHSASSLARAGEVAALGEANALGKDMLLAHGAGARPDEVKLMAETRTPIATTPGGEPSMGYPLQQTENFLAAGVNVGLGFDSIALSGNADMFRTMKTVQDAAKIRNQAQFNLSSRRVLEVATIGGARCLGLDDRTGSLTPGKRADVIMVSLLAPNMSVGPDPANLLVNSAAPGNVELVVADGRILKRDGKLTNVDVRQVLTEGAAALKGVRERAKWQPNWRG